MHALRCWPLSAVKRKGGFKSGGLAAAHRAGGDYFSFASPSKCPATAAGPCFAFRRLHRGLPDPAICTRASPALPPSEQSPVDPFCPHEIGTEPQRSGELEPGCSAAREGEPQLRCLHRCDIAGEEPSAITAPIKTAPSRGRGKAELGREEAAGGRANPSRHFTEGRRWGNGASSGCKTCASPWGSTPGHGEMIRAHPRYSAPAKIATDGERGFFRNA